MAGTRVGSKGRAEEATGTRQAAAAARALLRTERCTSWAAATMLGSSSRTGAGLLGPTHCPTWLKAIKAACRVAGPSCLSGFPALQVTGGQLQDGDRLVLVQSSGRPGL